MKRVGAASRKKLVRLARRTWPRGWPGESDGRQIARRCIPGQFDLHRGVLWGHPQEFPDRQRKQTDQRNVTKRRRRYGAIWPVRPDIRVAEVGVSKSVLSQFGSAQKCVEALAKRSSTRLPRYSQSQGARARGTRRFERIEHGHSIIPPGRWPSSNRCLWVGESATGTFVSQTQHYLSMPRGGSCWLGRRASILATVFRRGYASVQAASASR